MAVSSVQVIVARKRHVLTIFIGVVKKIAGQTRSAFLLS